MKSNLPVLLLFTDAAGSHLHPAPLLPLGIFSSFFALHTTEHSCLAHCLGPQQLKGTPACLFFLPSVQPLCPCKLQLRSGRTFPSKSFPSLCPASPAGRCLLPCMHRHASTTERISVNAELSACRQELSLWGWHWAHGKAASCCKTVVRAGMQAVAAASRIFTEKPRSTMIEPRRTGHVAGLGETADVEASSVKEL